MSLHLVTDNDVQTGVDPRTVSGSVVRLASGGTNMLVINHDAISGQVSTVRVLGSTVSETVWALTSLRLVVPAPVLSGDRWSNA